MIVLLMVVPAQKVPTLKHLVRKYRSRIVTSYEYSDGYELDYCSVELEFTDNITMSSFTREWDKLSIRVRETARKQSWLGTLKNSLYKHF